MIRTILGEEHRDVSTLRKGDVFHTDRNGTLPWSPWFVALEAPRLLTKRERRFPYYKGTWTLRVKPIELREELFSYEQRALERLIPLSEHAILVRKHEDLLLELELSIAKKLP